MAKAVPGVGVVLVGGVFAPGLIELGQIGLDLGAGDGEHGAEDAAFWKLDNRVNAGKAFGPGAADQFAQDGFGLVVEGVGCGDGIENSRGHEFAKPGVAKAAGGFFDGFVMLDGFGGGVDLVGVKLDAEDLGQVG